MRAANPYRDWIALYGGAEYRGVAQVALAQLERVVAKRRGPEPDAGPRRDSLARTFRDAARLEIGFWDMGLIPPG